MLLRADRVFDGHTLFEPGVLVTDDDGRVLRCGAPTASDAGAHDLGDVTLIPGYVDVHNHGGGGAAFADDPDTARRAHLAHGTTTVVASLVTQSLSDLEGQVRMLAPHVKAGDLAGIHLEGPWLAEAYKGAHPPEKLRDPAPDEVRQLLDVGDGAVAMVTIAVEKPGALESVALMAERGVVPALGHSDCTYDEARASIDAGVTGATHLFNAMPPLKHRMPGPVLALMDDDRVWCELIMDGVHVHPDLVAWVVQTLGDRAVFVTDAMAAAAAADGDYILGDLPVEVRNGTARIAGTDTIAGSTLTLDAAVRNAVAAGVPWQAAVRAATINPARYLHLADVGELRPGAWADAVTLDAEWGVRQVMRHGAWVS